MSETRHCATCRCAKTIVGQIAILLDSDASLQMTCGEIAVAIGYEGSPVYLRTTLDRMMREGKILRTGKRYGAMPESVDDLRAWVDERSKARRGSAS